MTPEAYCRNKAAPDGSNLYYATLYHDAQTRRIVHALFAFLHELNEAVYESSDPGVARVTLSWWFEEIGRLFTGTARHPVTLELSQLEHTGFLSQQEMLGCIATMAQFLDTPETGPYQDWLAQHEAAAGYIWNAACLGLRLHTAGQADNPGRRLPRRIRTAAPYPAFRRTGPERTAVRPARAAQPGPG